MMLKLVKTLLDNKWNKNLNLNRNLYPELQLLCITIRLELQSIPSLEGNRRVLFIVYCIMF